METHGLFIKSVNVCRRDAEDRPVGKRGAVGCAQLVLDVDTKTQRVILKKKVKCCSQSGSEVESSVGSPAHVWHFLAQEPGKRSQLWRMTGSGMLCHEGSSPPQSKPAQPRPLHSSLVLDIAGLAAVTDNRWESLGLSRSVCRQAGTNYSVCNCLWCNSLLKLQAS